MGGVRVEGSGDGKMILKHQIIDWLYVTIGNNHPGKELRDSKYYLLKDN